MKQTRRELDNTIDDTLTATFSTVPNFFCFFDGCDKDFAIFQGVDPDTFSKIETGRQRRGRKLRFHYRPEQHQLLVTVPNFEHDTATWTISAALYHDLNNMGLSYNDLVPSGTTKFGDGGSGKECGEADAAFMPGERADALDGWPTLVVETGLSQSSESLDAKMRWWFHASNHQVNIVLLVKLQRASHTICVEKYVKDIPQPRQGATFTRFMPALVPQSRQSITIAPHPRSQPVVYDVFGGPLVLEFVLLFLRPADLARGERDVVLDATRLVDLARQVWRRTL
ncbi:hypothetical protein CMQ_6830 [Grosmannia clavigera kw1407]|uniref:Dead deah box DNA helicase n=1 Tax=Grosmannia clavigera (strain kw1407 / UAMH 11150) TaxID=655863 RepID=F0X7L4_GROCL|nr:uncharacterized protein CMQ_6830 [Grosmannia clavigera kw1407]EFX06509.1 hypothetical protein CMQ_6830 [Grosmannia clavigera kw1407]